VMAPELEAYVRDAESKDTGKLSGFGSTVKGSMADPVKEKAVYFYFDPNSIPEAGWRKLGLPAKTIQTILHYRQKGGRFHTAADIRKIWGLSVETADQLIPYIRIAQPDSGRWMHSRQTVAGNPAQLKAKTRNIDINTATVEEWESLPGIGEVLAKRILAFRKRLGGFRSLEQVSRTYGLSDSVYRSILPLLRMETQLPDKLDLNSVTALELQQVTGITTAQAVAIIAYRKQYGSFQQIEDLRKIVFISDSVFQQIKPFLYIPEKL
ncbi:MAG: helix-hairpin-helix domain-containing protein, partial [Bacteroidota bacterium]|nr:helix-hairpin-helix domain-containing protein [Bacteroidota bacterium]